MLKVILIACVLLLIIVPDSNAFSFNMGHSRISIIIAGGHVGMPEVYRNSIHNISLNGLLIHTTKLWNRHSVYITGDLYTPPNPDTNIPEPATWLLIGTGMACLGLYRKLK